MADRRIVIVGAGMGGLAAAVLLSSAGFRTTVIEATDRAGGKMRPAPLAGRPIDAGPTVLTMRWVFDRLFDEAGSSLSQWATLVRAERLARHAWADGSRLDLYSDIDRSADAILAFAGAREARGYRAFCKRAQAIYETLRPGFIDAPRVAGPLDLSARVGLSHVGDLVRIAPFATMWKALGEHFADPRLRQLFGRYATYCGSSPFLAPATLMLVAHVEREGVWLVEGGMARLAEALRGLAEARGAQFRFGTAVARILTAGGRVAGVATGAGEPIAADAVIWNGDVAALADGAAGPEARRAVAAHTPERSLSAVTWAMSARVRGFPLVRHTVFFSRDSRAEFDDLFARGRLPAAPTVYLCAQDRGDSDAGAPSGPERVFGLVNAPARPANRPLTAAEIETCESAAFSLLGRCGLTIERDRESIVRTIPEDFAKVYPSTRGALYGPATHGWKATFAREGAKTRLPGLYLAGGSVHPGPGAPMAALSGRQAALSVIRDLSSTGRSRPAATPGGTSTR
ncbi:1-hydroxycarotenoid 3,4-desaturase [Roseiarcus fermentans]|uniref:1-hydroxycarotenoid 3,4-desaturase n=1 Tax=Roseiarcus fermentans TaxID=1473586 RepID=A0A366EKE7_9HYPH|nr:1-hydroxycarotenoid 3,4-desaturase CrtD [Roseiarcus fermentans]RBP02902.1 1-hydroxycarotenoid 3,4-desaturase [Roseiarcus fermentans]